MFRTLDLRSVGVAVSDPEPAASIFRKNFGLPLSGESRGGEASSRVISLAVGPARIEMMAPAGEGSAVARFLEERGAGLYDLELVVNDLGEALRTLSARGVQVGTENSPAGRCRLILGPAQTHGVRLVLVETEPGSGTR